VTKSQPTPERQDGHLADGGDGLEERLVARLEAHGPHLRAVDGLGGVGHPFELSLLLAERLDDTHAVDVLVDDLDQVALALLSVPGGREDPASHAIGDEEEGRRDDQAHQGEQG